MQGPSEQCTHFVEPRLVWYYDEEENEYEHVKNDVNSTDNSIKEEERVFGNDAVSEEHHDQFHSLGKGENVNNYHGDNA